MQRYCIYTLTDPRDRADRYVGLTKDVDQRLRLHLRDALYDNGACKKVRVWIAELVQLNLSPELRILETVSDPQDAMAVARNREHYWIQELTSRGAQLLNVEGLARAYGKQTNCSVAMAD